MPEEENTDQPEEIQQDTTTIQNQPYAAPLEGRMLFSREDLINAKELRTSEIGRTLYDRIMESSIYAGAKRAMLLLAANYCGSGLLLANLQKGGQRNDASYSNDILGAKIRLELDFIIATTAMCKSDRKSADLFNITTTIRTNAMWGFTRAQGQQRERVLNSKTTIAREDTITQRQEMPIMEAQQPKKWWEKK